jgi:hypothetical protein
MKTAMIAAKDCEYSGEDVEDFAERSQFVDIFKYLVNDTIQMSHVPVEQHGYVARKFLKGKIANHVLLVAAKSPDKVLTKGQIFDIVDAGIQGTTPGIITRGEKYLKASALQIGLDIEKKTGNFPELSQVLQEIKTLTQGRDDLSKFDLLSMLQWYLHLFRGGNENLRAICKKARECLKDSITVEQEDPKLMAEQLSHCGELWVQFWRTKGKPEMNGTPNTNIPNGNGNGKRTFPQAGNPNGGQTVKSKDWKGKGMEVTLGKTYSHALGKKEPNLKTDPLTVLGRENLSSNPITVCNTLWIKGWDRKKMDQLRKSGSCLICGQMGHGAKECGERQKHFQAEKFCFRPQM